MDMTLSGGLHGSPLKYPKVSGYPDIPPLSECDDNPNGKGLIVDALDELEDEFEVEATRRMSGCDRCGPAVMAKIYVAMPDGNELRYCYHCTDRHRARLNDLGAFLYELSA